MQQVTHIKSAQAQESYERLLAALGQWLVFMRTVREILPLVLSSGRPSKEAIENSIIGQLGFSSWKEFVDTETVNGGLGLGYSKWREWSRAWAVVRDLDEYADAQISATEINRIAQHCKKAEIDFPTSANELAQLKAQIEEKRATERNQAKSDLELENQTLKSSLLESNAKLSVLQNELESAKNALKAESDARVKAETQLEMKIEELKSQKDYKRRDQQKYDQELKSAQDTLRSAQNALEDEKRKRELAESELKKSANLTLVERIKRVFKS